MAFYCWSLVKDLQETPVQPAVLTFLSKFIIVIVLDIMHILNYKNSTGWQTKHDT